jgi:MoaA/NifB/PqqE/SkfB family radical SAM enzyme
MQVIEEITANAEVFRQAVRERAAFRPLYVKLKIIFGCNLKCEMCNHWRAPREAPLSNERLREILTELAALGCKKIHLSGGEPMLRAQVPELIAHASGLGIKVAMTTNGTLIDKALAKALVQAGLRGVNVSVDSPDRKTHDKVRGVPGAWKKTTRAIEHFQRYAHKGKLTLRINTVVNRWNYHTLAPMPDLAREFGANALNLIAVDDHCGPELSPHRRDIEKYNTEIAPRIAERSLALGLMENEHQAYPFGRTPREISLAKRGQFAFGWYDRHPCFAPWTHSLIDYNGLVYLCCMTRERIPPLGDLKTTSFTEIWHGARYQIARRLMHPPAFAPCRRCDDFLEDNRKLFVIASAEGAKQSPK